jgi:two-component system sensor histidine kinase/response regulator
MIPYERVPNVLVIDDEPTNRRLIRAYLGESFSVMEADSGAAGLDLLRNVPVDLVLLDVMMPNSDGYATCRRIKDTTEDGFLPVLFLTALGDQGSRNAGLEAGGDDFLVKPIDRRELNLRVRTFLRLRRQEARIRAQLAEATRLQALKDDLVGLLVHDIRGPLASLESFLGFALKDPAAQGELESDLTDAGRAAQRIRTIVEEMLQIQKLEDGEFQLSVANTCVADVAHEVVRDLQGMSRAYGAPLRLRADPSVVIAADPQLVRRAMENLVGNAIKFSAPGQEVEVAIQYDPRGATIEVADRGPGVPDALKKRIFGKYATVEPTVGRARRGFGLGLYFVQLVAQAHGGDVQVHDRENGGSLFHISLPRHDDGRLRP